VVENRESIVKRGLGLERHICLRLDAVIYIDVCLGWTDK
jgi:hypothetical protein